MCHCYGFNRKLNSRSLGKRYREDFWIESSGKKKIGVSSLLERKQDEQCREKVTEPHGSTQANRSGLRCESRGPGLS